MAYWLIFIVGILLYLEIFGLKQKLKAQQRQINELCGAVGCPSVASDYFSEEEKEMLRALKGAGQTVEAVKRIRERTGMELVEAKQYMDTL